MRIFAYRVVQKGPRGLEDVLSRLAGLPLKDRVFDGAASGMRLEDARLIQHFMHADLAVPRTGHGPGRMGLDAPLADIEMAKDEAFGEDAGLVYDPASGYLALQYNHVGPRIGRIQSYLAAADLSFGELGPAQPGQSDWDRCGFTFGAVLRPDAYRRLRQMGIVRKLEFSVSLPGALAEDRDLGRSLNQVLNAPLPDGIETLEVTMKAAPQRDSRLGRNPAMAIVEGLQAIAPWVKKAQVSGRRDEDSSSEEVDLVQERLSRDSLVAVGPGQRLPRTDRWTALATALRDWLANGDLEVGR